MNSDNLNDERYFLTTKVVMLGESSVGKSSIMSKFGNNNSSVGGGQMPTISPHFFSKVQTIYRLGSSRVKFNIWDTAG
jgi:GTPase SAR1 family protein